MAELAAVLVAAGRSRRMGGDKLWLELWGRPAWRWSLDTLLRSAELVRVALVVPPGAGDRFRALLPQRDGGRCLIVEGGELRSDSVRAGLRALADAGAGRDTLVLVHDAARPALDEALVRRVVAAARASGAAIPVVPVSDTLKTIRDGRAGATVSREELGAAQTPQAATLGILVAALDAAAARRVDPTDEAQALDAIGVPVAAVAGDASNLKLTAPGDDAIVRAILRERCLAELGAPATTGGRAGIGFDAHRFEAGRALLLGGMAFPDEPRGLAGHSDGDAALHAVIDALLGAAALGDVGTLFPSGEERWAGADSRELLRRAAGQLRAAGLAPTGIDLVVVAARPAIGPVRAQMAASIAGLVGLPAAAVTVKGTTSDGLGFAGEDGIAAYAVATVEATPAVTTAGTGE